MSWAEGNAQAVTARFEPSPFAINLDARACPAVGKFQQNQTGMDRIEKVLDFGFKIFDLTCEIKDLGFHPFCFSS
jgi:hypothetical protein